MSVQQTVNNALPQIGAALAALSGLALTGDPKADFGSVKDYNQSWQAIQKMAGDVNTLAQEGANAEPPDYPADDFYDSGCGDCGDCGDCGGGGGCGCDCGG